MDKPKVKFVSNQKTEVERVVHTAKQTWSGFYIKKRFVVLPKLKYGGVKEVILPNIGWEKIPDIENILKEIKLNFPIEMSVGFKTEIEKRLVLGSVENNFEKEWAVVEKDFWKVAEILTPEMVKNLKEIEVRMTAYGTISSYQFLKKGDEKLIVYVRNDASMGNLAEAILTALVYPYLEETGMVWEESEAMIDFVLKNSTLKKYFKKYAPTMKSLRESEIDNNQSAVYLKKLGIITEKPLRIDQDKIKLFGKSIDGKLTKRQNLILKLAIENSNDVVTFDEIAEVLWSGEENKYSLWAMNKFVERLRIKLVGLGLSPFVIKTVRGRGICLEN